MKKIAAVISSYNRGGKIASTVNSLLKQTRPFEKIIIVDDGSQKGRQVPSFKSKKISIKRLDKNVGVVWGRNLGISLSSDCDFVLIIDDDIELEPEAIVKLLLAFEEKKDCVAAMPVVYFKSQKARVWSSGSGVNLITGQTIFFTNRPTDEFTEIPAATSVLLAKVSDIKKSGWYDPLFYFCYEDADFYYRLAQKNGGKIYSVRRAVAYHDIATDLSLGRVAMRSYHIARGRVIFLSRYSKAFPFNLVFVLGFGVYYFVIGMKYGYFQAGLKYFLGVADGVFVYLRGLAKKGRETKFIGNLDISKIKKPVQMRISKVKL